LVVAAPTNLVDRVAVVLTLMEELVFSPPLRVVDLVMPAATGLDPGAMAVVVAQVERGLFQQVAQVVLRTLQVALARMRRLRLVDTETTTLNPMRCQS